MVVILGLGFIVAFNVLFFYALVKLVKYAWKRG